MSLTTNRILAYGSWAFTIAGAYMLGGVSGVFLAVGIPGLIIAFANEVVPLVRTGSNKYVAL
jgi:hypothetical protein